MWFAADAGDAERSLVDVVTTWIRSIDSASNVGCPKERGWDSDRELPGYPSLSGLVTNARLAATVHHRSSTGRAHTRRHIECHF